MTVMGKNYTDRKAAGEAIITACKSMTDPEKPVDLGEYRGFTMQLQLRGEKFVVSMKNTLTYTAELANEVLGNIARIKNALEKIPANLEGNKTKLTELHSEMENAEKEAERPFPQEQEYQEKSERLMKLNIELDNEGKPDKEAPEDSEEPERDAEIPEELKRDKPSIIRQLRNFQPPRPVLPGVKAPKNMEAAL